MKYCKTRKNQNHLMIQVQFKTKTKATKLLKQVEKRILQIEIEANKLKLINLRS